MAKTKKYWTVGQAIEAAAKRGITVTRPTIHKWARVFYIGHQPGGAGRWYIDPDKFIKFITGKPYYEANQDQDTIGICPDEQPE